jgi:hypothetical protein
MVDVDAMAEQAVREGWSWSRLAEELCWVAPGLDPVLAHATLCRVGHARAALGPLGATRAALRAALATAKAA